MISTSLSAGLGVGNSPLEPSYTRKIPTFSGSQYGTLSEAITFTGDFEVEVEFATTTLAINPAVGKASDAVSVFGLNADGKAEARFGDNAAVAGTTVIADGKIHKVIYKRAGTTKSIIVDGATEYSNTYTVVDVVCSLIGIDGFNRYFNGQLLSTKFTDKSGASDVVTNYVFDSGSTLYQMPRGEALGVTLFDDLLTAGGGGSINTVDGVTTVTNGATGFDYAYNTNALVTEAGKSYLVTAEIVSYTGANNTFGAGTAIAGIELGSVSNPVVGVNSFTFTAGDTTSYVRIGPNDATDGLNTIFKDLTIQEIPKACTLTNFSAGDWTTFLYTQNIIHDGGSIASAWVGGELVVNGGFDADTDWDKNTGVTISDGKAVFTGVSTFQGLQQVTTLTINSGVYLSGFGITGYSLGSVALRVGGVIGSVISSNAITSQLITSTASDQVVRLTTQGEASNTFDSDNISVKQLLEIA